VLPDDELTMGWIYIGCASLKFELRLYPMKKYVSTFAHDFNIGPELRNTEVSICRFGVVCLSDFA
jgi:hypothetical protein